MAVNVVTPKVDAMPTALVAPRAMSPAQIAAVLSEKSGVDVDKVARLMELQAAYDAQEAKRAYTAALVKFQTMAPAIIKTGHRDDSKTKKRDGTYGTVKYDYAELGPTMEQIRPLLQECQLAPTWRMVKNDPTWIELEPVLTHALGHSEVGGAMGSKPLDAGGMNEVQRRTATITMLKRATLFMHLGLVTNEDDKSLQDGERGQEEVESQPTASKSALTDPERKKKQEFVALCITKAGRQLTDNELRALYAEAQTRCGSDAAADCVQWANHVNVSIVEGGRFSLTPAMAEPTTDASWETQPNFICDECGQTFTVKPAKHDDAAGRRCLGNVMPIEGKAN